MADRRIIEEIKVKKNWDLWRKYYDEISFDEQKELVDYWAPRIRLQRQSNTEFFRKSFGALQDEGIDLSTKRVAELGSNDGWMAHLLMTEFKFKSYKGYEISRHRVDTTLQSASQLGFENIELHKQMWEDTIDEFDIFISGHTIEHFNDADCKKLLTFMCNNSEIIIIEVVTIGTNKNWNGCNGTHILRLSGIDMDKYISSYGFTNIEANFKPELFTGLYNTEV